MKKVLAINPGSTSTKIAVFEDRNEIFTTTLTHSNDELKKYQKITDQFEFRKDLIINVLASNNIDIKSLDAIVGRGGLLKPIKSGTYHICQAMINDIV